MIMAHIKETEQQDVLFLSLSVFSPTLVLRFSSLTFTTFLIFFFPHKHLASLLYTATFLSASLGAHEKAAKAPHLS